MNVWVQYFPGDCGTFISWFINQHTGFLQSKAQLKLHDPVPNEVVCESTTWDWRENTWSEHLVNRTENYDGESVAFKTYTEHCSSNVDEKTHQDHLIFINTVKQVPDLAHVLCEVPEDQLHIFERRLSHCFNSFHDDTDASTFYEGRDEDYSRQRLSTATHFAGDTVHRLNVFALLFERDATEYHKLCDALGLEPNPAWQVLCEFYTRQVFFAIP